MNKDSKIYVAGHRGLVGSAIIKKLSDKDYTSLLTRTHAELDLTNSTLVRDFFEKEKPEYVILAAAKVGGIVANNTYRADFIRENLMIQNNVIHEAYINGVQKLLFLGSTCIYPKNCAQPMKEEYLLTGPLEFTNEPYAIAKIAGIKMCESYNIQYGTNFISVMPTNLYGPNDNFDLEQSHVLPALIRKIILGKALENQNWDLIRKDIDHLPIEGVSGNSSQNDLITILSKYGITQSEDQVSVEIWGTGKPMREFLWSEDMADACVFLMENKDFKDICQNKIEIRNTHINIGTGAGVSIAALAELIKLKIDFQGSFIYNDSKPDGTLKKLTDVSKLNALGWKHTINLESGVERLIDWYQSYYSI